VAVGLVDVDARADGGGQRLLDEIDPSGPGLNARVDDGPLLHLGDAGGDADDHTGFKQADGGHLADELPEHPLGHVIVGDDAVPQRTDGDDVAGSTAQHLLSLGAYLEQFAAVFINGNHRGFLQDDPLILDIDQDAGSTQVNADIFCKHSLYTS